MSVFKKKNSLAQKMRYSRFNKQKNAKQTGMVQWKTGGSVAGNKDRTSALGQYYSSH